MQNVKQEEMALVKKRDAIVLPAVTPKEALDAWEKFQELKKAIIEPSDVQAIQGRQYLKKSFWRKIAKFFNLSVVVHTEHRVAEENKTITYEIIYRASAPNGAEADGDGACNTKEKGREVTAHVARGTAHSRAFNRAVMNLVGGSEVSADEMDVIEEERRMPQLAKQAPKAVPQNDPKTLAIRALYEAQKQSEWKPEEVGVFIFNEYGQARSGDLTIEQIERVTRYLNEKISFKDYQAGVPKHE